MTVARRRLWSACVACVLLWASVASAQTDVVPGRQEVWLASPEARAALFDAVAGRVQQNHLSRTTLNWQAWQQAYRPGVIAAGGQEALDRAFRRAFRGLDDDHSRWLGRRADTRVASTAQANVGPQVVNQRLGAGTAVLPGLGLLIERPYAGGLASNAGLHRGDVLVNLGGQALGALPAHELLNVTAQRLQRPAVLAVVLRRGVAKPVVLQPPLHRGASAPQRPYAQAIPGRHAVRLWIPTFESGTATAVARALGAVPADASTALLLDLRGNPGGSVREMLHTLALFAPDVRLTAVIDGAVRWRSVVEQDSGVTRVVLQPTDPYDPLGPLAAGSVPTGPSWPGTIAVLVDGRTNSAAEALAGALVNGLGVPAFGTATPGNVEMVRRMAFPAGHEAWVAFAELRDAAGEPLTPIVPAQSRPYRPQDLTTGWDAAEAAALAALTGVGSPDGPYFRPRTLVGATP